MRVAIENQLTRYAYQPAKVRSATSRRDLGHQEKRTSAHPLQLLL